MLVRQSRMSKLFPKLVFNMLKTDVITSMHMHIQKAAKTSFEKLIISEKSAFIINFKSSFSHIPCAFVIKFSNPLCVFCADTLVGNRPQNNKNTLKLLSNKFFCIVKNSFYYRE